jgi:hypothetical protein
MSPPSSDETPAPEYDSHDALQKRFAENRKDFPAEQLAAYAGKWVAWWPDGSRVFDADVEPHALFQRLRHSGHPESFFMIDLIPLPGHTEVDPFVALHMHFAENRDAFPADELAKHGGKLVAWWPDGTRIIDSDFDGEALVRRLRANGHDPSFLVLERVPYLDETFV